MKIILGVFNETFYKLKYETESLDYGNLYANNLLKEKDNEIGEIYTSPILSVLFPALVKCTEIVFDVTGLQFELRRITPMIVTLQELHVCVIYEELFNKTVFYKNGIVIDKNSFKEEYFDWMYDIGHNTTIE